MRKSLMVLLLLLLLIIATNYIPLYPLNRVVIGLAEKRLEADISYRILKVYPWRRVVGYGVTALGSGGFGLSAEELTIEYDPISIIAGRLHLACKLRNVKFYKSGTILNSITDLLHMRPLGDTTFKTIEGDLYVGRYDTLTQNLTLFSDDIKIIADAVTDKEDAITCLLYLFLKDDLTADIPQQLRNSLLRKEEGPWSSLTIGVIGNYQKPKLRIITSNFRMNIATK